LHHVDRSHDRLIQVTGDNLVAIGTGKGLQILFVKAIRLKDMAKLSKGSTSSRTFTFMFKICSISAIFVEGPESSGWADP